MRAFKPLPHYGLSRGHNLASVTYNFHHLKVGAHKGMKKMSEQVCKCVGIQSFIGLFSIRIDFLRKGSTSLVCWLLIKTRAKQAEMLIIQDFFTKSNHIKF